MPEWYNRIGETKVMDYTNAALATLTKLSEVASDKRMSVICDIAEELATKEGKELVLQHHVVGGTLAVGPEHVNANNP